MLIYDNGNSYIVLLHIVLLIILTKAINQKEAELQKLYAELDRTKSVETLEKLEDGVQPFKLAV